jgi:acetolactate synthase-1/3 small subunit
VGRELAMLEITPPAETRAEVLRIAEIFRGKIVDVGTKSLVVEVTGGQDKIDAITRLLEPLGLKRLVRTGPLAVSRGI